MSSSSLPLLPEEIPWYKNGLHFECTGCGACCTGEPGYVFLTEEEAEAIALYLNLSVEEFTQQHLRLVDGEIALQEDEREDENNQLQYDCTFLQGKRCAIYPVRPKQCRTYPWWRENLATRACWETESLRCEGIHSKAPLVPLKTIRSNLK